jgi:hypothetical protein
MSEYEISGVDQYLFSLITMFASSVWCQLGKIQDPSSGKIQKDFKKARWTIDMLIMLRDKTKGNLTKKEEDMITSTISNLQISYADETSRSKLGIVEKVENKTEEKK